MHEQILSPPLNPGSLYYISFCYYWTSSCQSIANVIAIVCW